MAKDPRFVQVTGSGQASATPDVVRLALGITCDGDDVSSALREAAARVRAIGEATRAQDVADADFQSTGAGVHPRYDRDGQRVVGYQANHRLSVVVRDVDRVGAVVDAVADVAGNRLSVDSIQLALSDASALQDEARTAAFLDARAKAGQYAALSDATLGDVVSVTEGAVAGGPIRPMARMGVQLAAADAMSVESGEQTVTAAVTVTWALSRGHHRLPTPPPEAIPAGMEPVPDTLV